MLQKHEFKFYLFKIYLNFKKIFLIEKINYEY